ncbi:MAG: DUF2892 domain-containing protein [Gammaproteobacteria bacterium]|nr:DUF2892 domain-containing protein [Gammaproteobacteria bacterium]
MKCNVGGIDMGARLIIGVILLIAAFTLSMSAVWQTVILVIATIAIVTAVIRFCPLNAILGFNTCSRKKQVIK